MKPPRLDRDDLELVLCIRDKGSLAAAARALHMGAPLATKRLAALEARLGLPLFQRSTRHISATAACDALCEHAADLLQRFAAVEERLHEGQSEPSGPIRLAATFGFGRRWVGPALARFQALHPRVEVRLQLTEQLPDLAHEGYDGAIWLWNAPDHRAGQWTARRLAENQRVLVAAPVYLKKHGAPATVQDLSAHACLVVRENSEGSGHRYDHWRLSRQPDGPVEHVPVRGPMSSNSGEMVRDWCLEGHGIMLRSLWDIQRQLASGELVRVLPAYAMTDADIHWLAPRQARVPRRIRLLVEHLARHFHAEPWKLRAAVADVPPRSSSAV